jgi:ATP-dependent RNA helicase HrpB
MADNGASPLPIDNVLPRLLDAMASSGSAVLVAAPGAGKTTRIPLALSRCAWCTGKVIVLEPRRLAARAAAHFVAAQIGEQAGKSIGYRVRLESRISPQTRVEFVTEGVFARMIGQDPELPGISAVVFDEFHERNLDGDLGLTLALETRSALRPDLRLLVMSATLQGKEVAEFVGGVPLIESEGRAFPVELRHLPRRGLERPAEAMARAILATLASEPGSVLCFLPGAGEIRQTESLLIGKLPADVQVHLLHGGLETDTQDAAIRPAPRGRRKLVLATPIAESSLTIDAIATVIDTGLRRVPRYEPRIGVTRLETVRASKAAANQRAGRAGRTAPGVAVRLWPQQQTASLPDNERPEILDADLSGLALTLADWGVTSPDALRWLTPPPVPAWRHAVELLAAIGAIDERGAATPHGRLLLRLPLAPRLGDMVVAAAQSGQARQAVELALLVSERGIGGRSCDIALRQERLRADSSIRAQTVRSLARSIAAITSQGNEEEVSVGGLLSIAFPDRIAKGTGHDGRFALANGRGARLDVGEPLSKAPFVVVVDMQGSAASARIVTAAAIAEEEVLRLHGNRIEKARELAYDEQARAFRVTVSRRLGALLLAKTSAPLEDGDDTASALIALIGKEGLSVLDWDAPRLRLKARLSFLHRHDPQRWPAMDDETLAAAADWLLPFLDRPSGAGDIPPALLGAALRHRIETGGASMAEADRLAPDAYRTPAGIERSIDYRGDKAFVSVRVQEMFGATDHPTVLDGRVPVVLELLSPAMRPIQVTTDLAGFWTGSWHDVRRDMRGRYPKHDWPQDPAAMAPSAGRRRARIGRRS